MPYQEDEITAPRIASFVGSTNNIEFLRSDLGNSRWISFEIDSISYLDKIARNILEKAWGQAYHLYKLNEEVGELSKEDIFIINKRSDDFKIGSVESELIKKYFIQSTKEEGGFMTATDILIFLQSIVSGTIRLNNIILGKALRELGFNRVKFLDKKGYFVQKK